MGAKNGTKIHKNGLQKVRKKRPQKKGTEEITTFADFNVSAQGGNLFRRVNPPREGLSPFLKGGDRL